MVEQLDIQEFARFAQLLSSADIFRRRRGIARRMVVDDNNRRACPADGWLEDLRDAHHATVDRTLINNLLGHDIVLGIETEYAQLLLS